MTGRPNFHRSFGDIHIREFAKLVIHARQFLLHVFSRLVRDVEIRAAVFGPAPFLRFGVDSSRYYVARGEVHPLRIVALHKAFAVFVAQYAAFATHGFGHQNSLHARRPDHSGRMKLDELHIHQFGASIISQGHAVAGVFPRI